MAQSSEDYKLTAGRLSLREGKKSGKWTSQIKLILSNLSSKKITYHAGIESERKEARKTHKSSLHTRVGKYFLHNSTWSVLGRMTKHLCRTGPSWFILVFPV